MKNFFQITCRLGTEDARLFTSIVNQGIDAHLEAFTESKFSSSGGRLIMEFHNSELPILLRRLRELESEHAESWADDIESVKNDD